MKHTRAAALLAAVALAAALTLGAAAAPIQSQGGAVSASQESRPKAKRGTESAERRPAVARPGAEETVCQNPVTSTAPAPVPEKGPSDYERVEGLRAYLLETLPPESYAYLDRGAHSGALTIGYLDKAAIQKAVADYTGEPCPVCYEEAHCSEAQNRAFWKAAGKWTLPVGARLERVGPPAAREGLFLAIHATSEKQAQSLERKLHALAKKQGYPTESLTITCLLSGENPNT